MEHSHKHYHDEHHQHTHDQDYGPEPHTHMHKHEVRAPPGISSLLSPSEMDLMPSAAYYSG